MTDQDIERRLRRYRATGPAPQLRAHVLEASVQRPVRRGWWWTTAAAVLVAAALRLATGSTYDAIRTTVLEPARAAREALVTQLAQDLGGGARAHAMADRMVRDAEAEMATLMPEERQ